ncbi:ATP-binding protein [Desulfosporosinus meridiei]|uniref:histidine kinase n=1 Tax=Desulfosporosinus meridiei (strain ATCC BAA-275 / DSM 13257 / KCTC 12902 / NCIMB 13706 / S10) TaxID=768704 RepID=J7J082_DESMD|nr:ATP-binding protein [Desulfosporosinus meridiei]AFQ44733.1 PAS domain S-box [Desulfosporosinus meridiei DSM 13257]
MKIDNYHSEKCKLDELLSSHFFNCIPEACVMLDPWFYIVKMNSQAEEFFLLPQEYLMSKPFWEIAPQYINTNIFHAMYKIKNDRQNTSLEFCGSITNRWFEANLCMIDKYIVVFFKNITHHKHTQNELLRAQERLSAVFHNSHALMAIVNQDNNQFVSVNDSFADFFGYSANEIIGKTKEDIFETLNNQFFPPQIPEDYDNNSFSKLISVKSKSSDSSKHIIITSELININEKPCRLEIGIDITDNLRCQKELRRLEHLNLLGQMSASIAHEIRNPLQTVKGFLQLLQFKEGISPYQTHFNLMIDELNRANQIITELLCLSRTKPTNLKMHTINDIINSVLPLIEAQALAEDKIIMVEQMPVSPTLLDEDEIKQVLLNIVKNALEATKSKGCVKIISESNQTSVKLIICDNGQGIPPELQDNIGMPFFTTKQNGTGLGLPMSLSILERHNAKLDFISDKNGTSFIIIFPIVA